MTNTHADLIEKYRKGYDAVIDALKGATPAELEHRPGPGKWSAKEVVHHLADSETMAAMRIRLVVGKSGSLICGYDPDQFAVKFNYNSRPIENALAAFKIAHETTLEILPHFTAEDWSRQAWHTESGLYSAEKWLATYSKHSHDHAGQIRRAIESARQK
ncbi:MAG: DinB family protein [Planctomycetota bacterium]